MEEERERRKAVVDEDTFFARVLSTVGIASQLATVVENQRNQEKLLNEVRAKLDESPSLRKCAEQDEKVDELFHRMTASERWLNRLIGGLVLMQVELGFFIALLASGQVHFGK